MKFYLATLGCPRNQLDSDFVVELLDKEGLSRVFTPARADFCLVNTCAFIQSAKEESLEEIFSLIERKRRTIVLGCLAQRYGQELFSEIPELKAVVSPDNYPQLPVILDQVISGKRVLKVSDKKSYFYQPQNHSTRCYAYLRLTEGCSNRCSYCAIPNIRGSLRSFSLKQLLNKVRKLLSSNYKELILVGQDITAFGLEKGTSLLVPFLNQLAKVEGEFWIRLLYLNPLRVEERLLETMSRNPKILPYFDLPYQHFSPRVLKRMGRPYTAESILSQLEKVRKFFPDAVIRTTLMVGFPGETEKDFDFLLEGVKEAGFDYVGVFDYSKEEGTKAAGFSGQVPEEIRKERKEKLSFFANELSFKRLGRFIGKEVEVLVEGSREGFLRGRFFGQAPEIDGEVFFRGKGKAGEFKKVVFKKQEGFDFLGVEAS